MGVVIVKFTHAIARVLERIQVWAGRGTTFGASVNVPFVASLPAVSNRAPAALCRGSCDCWVVAAPSIPQAKVGEVPTFQASDTDLPIVPANLFHGF
jgi:hypothetical protein